MINKTSLFLKFTDDITTIKLKTNNLVNLKNNAHNNEENVMVDNIVLLCENNLSTAVTTNCNLLSNQFILGQTNFNVNQSRNSEIIEVDLELGMFFKVNFALIL